MAIKKTVQGVYTFETDGCTSSQSMASSFCPCSTATLSKSGSLNPKPFTLNPKPLQYCNALENWEPLSEGANGQHREWTYGVPVEPSEVSGWLTGSNGIY